MKLREIIANLERKLASEKVKASMLPNKLKSVLKEYRFAKREISVEIKGTSRAYANQHAPEYDNFDYTYILKLNLKTGALENLQHGLKGNDVKEVTLGNDEVVINGDKLGHYASLECNFETFEEYFVQAK